jgi:hypothetical protein
MTDEVLEYIIHHGLEGGWAVGHSIQHYQRFEELLVASKGCLPLITFLDSDVLVAPIRH